jgi:hypothetical protein
MANGDPYVRAVERIYACIDKSSGRLICSGGLPALAGTRRERQFEARNLRARYFVSAALDGTRDRIVSAQRSR